MNCTAFEQKLLQAGLSREDFSKLTNTPMGTIQNWITSRKGKVSTCAKWVEAYLSLYVENNENKVYIKKLLEEVKKGSITNEI